MIWLQKINRYLINHWNWNHCPLSEIIASEQPAVEVDDEEVGQFLNSPLNLHQNDKIYFDEKLVIRRLVAKKRRQAYLNWRCPKARWTKNI